MKETPSTVFIVDDDNGVRSSIRVLMKSVGLAATPFSSAQEFLEAYQPHQAGCLVLDIRMPGMSGLELQQALNAKGAVIPVIFITGHADVPMAVEAMRLGAFDFPAETVSGSGSDRPRAGSAHSGQRDTRGFARARPHPSAPRLAHAA